MKTIFLLTDLIDRTWKLSIIGNTPNESQQPAGENLIPNFTELKPSEQMEILRRLEDAFEPIGKMCRW